MRLLGFVILLFLALLLTGSALAAVLIYFDPFQAPDGVIALFYLALFLFSISLLSLVILGLKKAILINKEVQQLMPSTLRQAFLLGLAAVVFLWLQQRRWLNWPSAVVLLVVFVFIEVILFFRSKGS